MEAFAQGDPAGAGLDLVVAVDRSGSMTGRGRPSPDVFVRLALELVARDAEGGHIDHRFGAITFGSAPRVDVPLTPVTNGGAMRLRHRLDSISLAQNLGNTDVVRALTAVRQLFRAFPAGASRRRVLLLITDGVPYVPRADAGAYAREIRRFAPASAEDPSIEVLLLPARSARDEQLWRDLSHGHVHMLGNDAYVSLYRAVSGVVGTRTVEAGGDGGDTIVVPPYLDTIVFDVFRGRPPGKISIFAPDALRPLTAGAEGVGEARTGELLSTVVVRRPAPGRWTFKKSRPEARVKVFSQQFFPRGTLVQPADAALRQYDRVAVAYRVTDTAGAPIRELPGYPLHLELMLIAPNGERRRVAMQRDPLLGAGVFRAIEESECDTAGRYWTEIDVRTRDADERLISVFYDRWSGFRVAPAARIDCRVTSSESLLNASLAMRLNCIDTQARPVDLQALARGSPAGLFRPLLSRDGRPTAAQLDLEYLGRGAFRGWLDGFSGPGLYSLRLAVDRAQLAPTHNIRVIPAAALAFRRNGWIERTMLFAVIASISFLLLAFRRATRRS